MPTEEKSKGLKNRGSFGGGLEIEQKQEIPETERRLHLVRREKQKGKLRDWGGQK